MMKKRCYLWLLCAPLLVSANAWATAAQELEARLAKITGLQANFNQRVLSPEGKEINQGAGTLALRRPNLFRWETKLPDETLLVADGKTLWYFDPFVEQVTAMWVSEATAQTPFVLLTSNDKNAWARYNITQQGDNFTLSPKDGASATADFRVKVSKAGKISEFAIIEQDGQQSQFSLDKVQYQLPAMSLFTFTPPAGVALDDQRDTHASKK